MRVGAADEGGPGHAPAPASIGVRGCWHCTRVLLSTVVCANLQLSTVDIQLFGSTQMNNVGLKSKYFFKSYLNNHHLKVNTPPLHFHLDAFDVFVQHLSFS